MNRSIRPYFTLLACAVIGLTLSAPFISRGDDGEGESLDTIEQSSANDASDQLDEVFERIGVNPDATTDDEGEPSWMERVTGAFQDDEELESATAGGMEPTPIDSQQDADTVDDAVSKSTSIDDRQTPTGSAEVSPSNTSPESAEESPTPINPVVLEPAPSLPSTATVTLDELIQQARGTTRLQRENLHASLEERRRLALAMRATLEAASQVANYGQAGSQLLQDASLDTIVSTMIAEQERDKRQEELRQASSETNSPSPLVAVPEEPITTDVVGFDAWRPVHIVHDNQGYRIGWRNPSSGERVSAYVGESLYFGDDIVSILSVSSDRRGRSLILDVNGEQHLVRLF